MLYKTNTILHLKEVVKAIKALLNGCSERNTYIIDILIKQHQHTYTLEDQMTLQDFWYQWLKHFAS